MPAIVLRNRTYEQQHSEEHVGGSGEEGAGDRERVAVGRLPGVQRARCGRDPASAGAAEASRLWQPVEELASRRFPCRKARGRGCSERACSAKRALQRAPKLIVDSTVLDQAGFEMQHGRNSNRYPRVWWKAVDGALLRRVKQSWNRSGKRLAAPRQAPLPQGTARGQALSGWVPSTSTSCDPSGRPWNGSKCEETRTGKSSRSTPLTT